MKFVFSRVLCLFILLLLIGSAQAASSFSDVAENASYGQAIEYVSSQGIMGGYADGRFGPANTVTRGQMAALICRIMGQPNPSMPDSNLFSDVPASHWANAYIATAASQNIISGFKDRTFRPDQSLNYNQGITMLIRAFGLKNEAERAGGYPTGYLAVAQKYHLLNGISSARKGNIKRYEIALIIYNYYNNSSNSQTAGRQDVASSLADGEYSARVFGNPIQRDRNGNEIVYAEILDAAVLDNSYVKSLKIGDQISLKKPGLDWELDVTMLENLGNEIILDEYTYLTPYKNGWMIWQDELPVEYIVESTNLVLSADTEIIDGITISMMKGEYTERRISSLQSFIDEGMFADAYRTVIITVGGGKVVKLEIPYTPM